MNSDYVVYPRLKRATAEDFAFKFGSQSVSELFTEYDGKLPVKVSYAPTGNRVRREELLKLQQQVRSCAVALGYPETNNISSAALTEFDNQCSVLLHQSMNIAPAEAAHVEVWAFITCILLPDVVRWRFNEGTTAVERFIGSDRGLRRNTLGRLWWRAYLLHNPNRAEPYDLIYRLTEDELVQFTERPIIASDPLLFSASAEAFLAAVEKYPELTRRSLIREGTKRLRRLLSLLSFEALDEGEVIQIMHRTFEQTAQALIADSQSAVETH